jgi:hypothetical protein
MAPEQDMGAERPRAVTIIGRLSLVVAVFCLCKNLVGRGCPPAVRALPPSRIA